MKLQQVHHGLEWLNVLLEGKDEIYASALVLGTFLMS